MNRLFHRRARPLVTLAALAVAAALASPAAMAHEGHGSCAPGAQSFTVPTAQEGQLDEAAREAAQSGEPGAGDESEQLHAQGCEPRP